MSESAVTAPDQNLLQILLTLETDGTVKLPKKSTDTTIPESIVNL